MTSPVRLEDAALFLDLDGTLAPIAQTPEAVAPDPRRTDVLRRAHQALGGRLAIISGRTVDEVDRILERCSPHVAGAHGLQIRVRDDFRAPAPHPAIEEAANIFADASRGQRGLRVEPKGLSVALHYRQAPEAGPAINELAERLAQSTGLELQKGRMVVELRTPGADKGDAIRAFMIEADFAGTTPIFVGDDLTDEAGFDACVELGGFGVLVGAHRETLAAGRLSDPAAVLHWIEAALTNGYFTQGATQ